MDLVSIIIPVYNAAAYLSCCVDSIYTQTYQNFEILLVDDGSTDNSSHLCREYAEKDKRVRYIYKKHEGVSVARNIGIKEARGEWIAFCDADDFWRENTFLEKFVEAGNIYGVDVVRGNYRPVDAAGCLLWRKEDKRKKYAYKVLTPLDFLNKAIGEEFFIWLCLFRKETIVNNGVFFKPNRIFLEDAEFFIHLLQKIHSGIYLPVYFYAYRKTGQSVSYGFSKKKLNDSFDISRIFISEGLDMENPRMKREYRKRGYTIYRSTLRSIGIETPYFLRIKDLCNDFSLVPIYKYAYNWWSYFSPISHMAPQSVCVWFRYGFRVRYACFRLKCHVMESLKKKLGACRGRTEIILRLRRIFFQ